MTIQRLLSAVLCLCAAAPALRPQTVEFTPESLNQAIEERSAVVRLARLAVDESAAGVSVARSAWLPEISASWDVGYLGNGYLTDRDFSHGMGVTNPHFTDNFALEAMQTVYSGGAVPAGVRLAELGRRMASLSLDQDREQVRFLLMSHLIDLDCLGKQRSVIRSNIELAEKLLATMRARHAEGVVLKSDITRYELHVSSLQLQLDAVEERIDNLNHRLATALDYPASTTFALRADAPDEDYPMPGVGYWQELAAAQSPALGKAMLGIDISQARLRLAQADRLPHVRAYAYGRFDSPIVTEVPVLDKNFMYWGFGLNVSYSLSSLYKSNKSVGKARIAVGESRTQLELARQSLSDNISDTHREWTTACSDLRTRRAALRLAQENYDIVSERFNEGMALVTDLVDAANVRVSAQTGVDNASSRLLYCLCKLRYLSNTL